MTASPSVPSDEAGSVLPLVDPRALSALAEEVSPATASSFARDFARIWPRRREALIAALGGTDLTIALDAALSLRTSSVMVGAARLAALSERLEQRLRTEGFAAAAQLLGPVIECGELTVVALQGYDGGTR